MDTPIRRIWDSLDHVKDYFTIPLMPAISDFNFDEMFKLAVPLGITCASMLSAN